MSWYLSVLKLTPEGKRWNPHEPWPENGLIPLGTRAEIHTLIAKLFPKSDFSDPLWIPVWFAAGENEWSMEIVLDKGDPVRWLNLRHGDLEAARLIYEHTGWDVFDPEYHLMNFDI